MKFKNIDFETLTYIHSKAEVGSELWKEAGYEMSARQESLYWDMKQIRNRDQQKLK